MSTRTRALWSALFAVSVLGAAETRAYADDPQVPAPESPPPVAAPPPPAPPVAVDPPAAPAEPPDPHATRKHSVVTLTFAPYDVHLSRKTGGEYNAWPLLIGLEYEGPKGWGVAGAFFSNSFHQPTAYLGMQRRYTWGPEDNAFFVKVSAGVLYGYKRPHDLAVPLNFGGLSPAIVPALGYKYWRVTVEMVIFGFFYGVMGAVGFDIWK